MSGYFNSYTITKPIGDNGKKAKYTKLLDFLKAHRGEEFTRFDLFLQSGYWNVADMHRFATKAEDWETTMNSAFRGQNSYVTTAMREKGIIEYNPSTKKWRSGKNIDSVKY